MARFRARLLDQGGGDVLLARPEGVRLRDCSVMLALVGHKQSILPFEPGRAKAEGWAARDRIRLPTYSRARPLFVGAAVRVCPTLEVDSARRISTASRHGKGGHILA